MKYAWITLNAICMLFGLLGCVSANVYYPGNSAFGPVASDHPSDARIYREKIRQLKQQLIALDESVEPAEAQLVAETALRESAILAEEYQLVRPAVAHNLLVALGIKNRGLCYHWTEDLMGRLQTLDLKSLQLYWGVAYRGSELREHNCVVITARDKPFRNGIVLDPWRNSGNLFWARVIKDSYPWKVLPRTEW